MARKPFRRQYGRRPKKYTYLIITEGECTEPQYLNEVSQKYRNRIYAQVRGEGKSPKSLLEKCLRLQDEGIYDEKWIVFDRDNWTHDEIHQTIRRAQANDINVAISNQSFEIWFILHFENFTARWNRNQYASKIEDLINRNSSIRSSHYNRSNIQPIIEILLSNTKSAITNARRLVAEYQPMNCLVENPSTTIHFLVKSMVSKR